MELGLEGQRVTQETADFTWSLVTDGGYEVRVETNISMQTPQGNVTFSVGEENLADNPSFHSLLHQTVTSAIAEESGTLTLTFSDGTRLRVEPNDLYEAWTVAGPHGKKIVSMPQGELAIWSETEN